MVLAPDSPARPLADDKIHGVHPYPCKFPAATARRLLDDAHGLVLDPFAGSGTTLLEAARLGLPTIGWDCNPIAALITRFKLLDATDAQRAAWRVHLVELDTEIQQLVGSARLHDFAGRDHWFQAHVQDELAAILAVIAQVEGDEHTWLQLALSAIVNRVGNQDTETRYARVERTVPPGSVVQSYVTKCMSLLDALATRGPLPATERQIECVDVQRGFPIDAASVDVIATSPPYANTMDYYLYHKQRMNVLGFDYSWSLSAEIGSRREFSSLKAGPQKWEDDYAAVLAECARVLAPAGHATVVIGDSIIAGEFVDAGELTTRLATMVGLDAQLVDAESLDRRGGSFNSKFRRHRADKREHIIRLTHT